MVLIFGEKLEIDVMDDVPIEAILRELDHGGNDCGNLKTLDAANYLNNELLQQLDLLRQSNEEVSSF